MNADTVIYGNIAGRENETRSGGSYIAIRDGRIISTGSKSSAKEYIGRDTAVTDLGESFISPGFTDGHAHITFKVKCLFDPLDLHNAKERGGYEKLLKEYLISNPKKNFIYGQGFSVTDFGEKGPSSKILDNIFGDIPVIIQSDGCHDCWVSSCILRRAGIDRNTPDPCYGEIVRDAEGNPTGFFREEASELIDCCYPPVSVCNYKKAILMMQEKFLKEGITNVYEPVVLSSPEEMSKAAKAYHALDREGKLKLKVRAGLTLSPSDDIDPFIDYYHALREETRGSHFEIMGVKLFMDGVVEGHSAYLRDDYSDRSGFKSEPLWEQDRLNEACLKLLKNSIPVHVHSMGDASTDMILDALSNAKRMLDLSDEEMRSLRNAITHLQVLSPDQFERMAGLGIIGVANTFWHFIEHSYYNTCDIPFLGKKRAEAEYPVKSLVNAGIILSQASDWPVSEPNSPLIGMEIAVTRRAPGHPERKPQSEKEAIDTKTAFDMLTVNGAYQLKLEESSGSIEAGKSADLVILDGDPLNPDPCHIHEIKVKAVYIDGEEVYNSSSSSVQST